jgi:glyceraldehyde-3-phosphate dehydrogenase (EC 1.2.1.12)
MTMITNSSSVPLRYDSVHRPLNTKVEAKGNAIVVDNQELRVFCERDPAKIPWGDMGVDIVMECTGLFRDKGGSSRVDLQACKLGTGRRFTTS